MNKQFLFFLIFLNYIVNVSAQEIVADSIATNEHVLPKVALTDKYSLSPVIDGATENDKEKYTGLTVYNTTELLSTSNTDGIKEGINTWDGQQWKSIGKQSPQFFYLPAIKLPLKKGETNTFDLYGHYLRMFSPQPSNPNFISSEGITHQIPEIYSRHGLEYAVLDYDTELIEITGLSHHGVLSYHTLSDEIPSHSYITIICIIKD